MADLYFIRAGNFVKIGRTSNIKQRIRAIQCGCPLAIDEVIVVQGCGDEEQGLHHRFEHRRVRGEWFEWCEDIEKRARDPVRSLPRDEVNRRYEAVLALGRRRHRPDAQHLPLSKDNPS